MERESRVSVECLHCAQVRTIDPRHGGECPRCGYLGWAPTRSLDESVRRALRDRPVERRRLRAVA